LPDAKLRTKLRDRANAQAAVMPARHAQQDYVLVAGTLAEGFATFEDDTARTVMMFLMTKFAKAFQNDNPNFNLERFLKACKVPNAE
jgi:hypothetical protein